MASGYLYVTVDMYSCRIKVEGVAGQPRFSNRSASACT